MQIAWLKHVYMNKTESDCDKNAETTVSSFCLDTRKAWNPNMW